SLFAGTVVIMLFRFALSLGAFWSLAIGAIMFFGVYGLMLLLLKENLTCELCGQLVSRFLRKKR
ncbi:MAG: flippase, partial [Clostridia bacterium]|nr:flippase [Clostridia bacterium]